MLSKLRLWADNKLTRRGSKPIEIEDQSGVKSVAFLADGAQIVGCGGDGKIRRWQVKGKDMVGAPMHVGNSVLSIAASQDGKWIVAGTWNGRVKVWNTENHEKAVDFKGHNDLVLTVDVSPDGTKVATGSKDQSACVWSLSTGQQLLTPIQYDYWVKVVKFSPDGLFLAIVTGNRVRIHDYRNGRQLADFEVKIAENYSNSRSESSSSGPVANLNRFESSGDIAWSADSKQLFALSEAGFVYRLDIFSTSGTKLSEWGVDNQEAPKYISLASNGAFVAVCYHNSVSFWDTTTRQRINYVIHHPIPIVSISVSANFYLVIGGGTKITLHKLRDFLPPFYFENRTFEDQRRRVEVYLKEMIQSIRLWDRRSDEKEMLIYIEKTIQELYSELAECGNSAKENESGANETIKSLRERNNSLAQETIDLTRTHRELRAELAECQQKIDSLTKALRVHRQKIQCENLFTDGDIFAAAQHLSEISTDDAESDMAIVEWLSSFKNTCITALERIGDEALERGNREESVTAYSVALSLGPSALNALSTKWASTILLYSSASEALNVAAKFKLPKVAAYRAICDILEGHDRLPEAVKCFWKMQRELIDDLSIRDEQVQWEIGFQQRCRQKLEVLANMAIGSQEYGTAAKCFSTILSLGPPDRMNILVTRSKVRALMGSWEDALGDADEAINLDPSYYRGYKRKFTALQGAGRHMEAVEAFDSMLSKFEESSDENVRELRSQFTDARPVIRRIINDTISPLPRVLIDTITGHLCDKGQQAEAFETLPIFHELVSSMSTNIDEARIRKEVKRFYRYVMFSHKWEHGESLHQKFKHITVYELEDSLTNTKLKMFCSVVRDLGFRWAWSDTCCIDKENNVVLQESLVAMFSWYRGSSLTIVYLRGVRSESQGPGGLRWSIWNTRVWTYQEYLASETVQFYTEDWKPYLGLTLWNHKESSIVISEMEQASHVSAEQSAVLRPGLDRVREKLFLASMRQTTFAEDVVYALLGIFKITIPVMYGEGNRAIGRLLEHILSGSGDVTILAWTGKAANDYNTCLPMDLSVYSELVPPHIPRSMETAEVDEMVTKLRSSILDFEHLATMLYDRLNGLPLPSLNATRLRLPGIVSAVTNVVRRTETDSTTQLHVYHGTSTMFSEVEIKTANLLTTKNDLYLVHPWIRPLLDQEFSRAPAHKTVRSQRMVARLKQPFGALLFEQMSRLEFRRVALDSLVVARVQVDALLTSNIDDVCTIDVQ